VLLLALALLHRLALRRRHYLRAVPVLVLLGVAVAVPLLLVPVAMLLFVAVAVLPLLVPVLVVVVVALLAVPLGVAVRVLAVRVVVPRQAVALVVVVVVVVVVRLVLLLSAAREMGEEAGRSRATGAGVETGERVGGRAL